MQLRFKALITAGTFAAGLLISQMTPRLEAVQARAGQAAPASGQAAPAYRAPRTADGKPNLNGVWQAMNEANWDLEPHAAYQGSLLAEGAHADRTIARHHSPGKLDREQHQGPE